MTRQSLNTGLSALPRRSRTMMALPMLAMAAFAFVLTTYEPAAYGQTPLYGESMQPTPRGADSIGTVYSGGPVFSDVQIVAVFWGPSVHPTITSQIGGFYAAYVQASQIGWMCEYNTPTQTIGSGSFAGNFTITPTIATGTTITDTNIRDEIAAQVNAGHLPTPNDNTLYMVH